MSYRSRVYKTTKLKNGNRIVASVDTSEWLLCQILNFTFKGAFYLLFFWIIIPIKLFKRK